MNFSASLLLWAMLWALYKPLLLCLLRLVASAQSDREHFAAIESNRTQVIFVARVSDVIPSICVRDLARNVSGVRWPRPIVAAQLLLQMGPEKDIMIART